MTRQDFQLIADVLKGWVAQDPRMADMRGEQETTNAAVGIAHNMASALAATNPRFDRARFLRACGVDA